MLLAIRFTRREAQEEVPSLAISLSLMKGKFTPGSTVKRN
jgi:hypothetical protein